MQRTSRWVVAALVLIVAGSFGGSVASQDDEMFPDNPFRPTDTERVEALEAQVDDLRRQLAVQERRLDALEGGASGTGPRTAPATGGRVFGTVNFIGDAGVSVLVSEDGCSGMGAYADLAPGSVVTATDENSVTAGRAALVAGPVEAGTADRHVECAMSFEMAALPPAAGYRFEFGEGRFLDVPYADLERDNFMVGIPVYRGR